MIRRVLQLIHVTDLHFFTGPNLEGYQVRSWLHRAFACLPKTVRDVPLVKRLFDDLVQGTAGHSPDALAAFEASVADWVDRDWQDVSWLVTTGDVAAWGEDASIAAGLQWLADVAARLGIRWTAIYGNHDVWLGPGQIPLPWNATGPFDRRRSALRRAIFARDWPQLPLTQGVTNGTSVQAPSFPVLSVPLASGRGRLLCGSLNTVLHEPAENSLALGEVRADRYWEGAETRHQMDVLKAGLRPDDVLVLLTHHPLHDPQRRSGEALTMILKNSRDVADSLRLRALVVLSGHTHQASPDPGKMPERLPAGPSAQEPLDRHQLQLTAGTLAQRGLNRPDPLQDWQLLRFWEDDQPPHRITLERSILARAGGGVGVFRPSDDGQNATEKIEL
jgi:3',5'-cyclic AMP phosphodiesterase CpdA